MSPKWKSWLFAAAAVTVALAGVALAIVFVIIPKEQRKAADALLKASMAKASALQAAAALMQKQAAVQTARVDAQVAQDKKLDPVDFANSFINSRVKT